MLKALCKGDRKIVDGKVLYAIQIGKNKFFYDVTRYRLFELYGKKYEYDLHSLFQAMDRPTAESGIPYEEQTAHYQQLENELRDYIVRHHQTTITFISGIKIEVLHKKQCPT